MKAIYSLVLVLLISLFQHVHSQTIQLTYTGKDTLNQNHVVLDSIVIRNINTGRDTVLRGNDTTLLLDVNSGISDLNQTNQEFELVQNFPNPFTTQTTFLVRVFEKDNFQISLVNIYGQLVFSSEGCYGEGTHMFTLSGGRVDFYILLVKNSSSQKSIKLVQSQSFNNSSVKISYLGYQPIDHYYKSVKNSSGFPYNKGDRLQFVGYASGYELGVLYDSPQSNANYTFSFEVPENFVCGQEYTDPRDGKKYNTIKIGGQCWMAENLNIGTKITSNTDQANNKHIEKYCYNDDENNCNLYGGLYQWDEVMQYDTNRFAQGICPAGWHLPTVNEWNALIEFYGGPMFAGDSLKPGGNSGFDALMAGKTNQDGIFSGLNIETSFWTTDLHDIANSNYFSLYQNNSTVSFGDITKSSGFSVRCIKGLHIITKPNVVIIDTTIYTLISDSIELSQGTYKYLYGSKRKANDIHNHDIIIGITEAGYLRQVEGISDNPPILTLQTSQGTLEDVFEQAEFEIPLNSIAKNVKAATSSSETNTLRGLHYFISNFSLLTLPNIAVGINEYELDFTFNPELDIKIKNGVLRKIEFSMESSLQHSIEIGIIASILNNYKYSKSVPLASYGFNFMAGPIPILGTINFELAYKLQFTLNVAITATMGYSTSDSYSAGIKYENGQITNFSDFEHQTELNANIFPATIQQRAIKFSVGPQASILLYGIAGPYAFIGGYLKAIDNKANPPSINVDSEKKAGVDLDIGIKAGIFGFTFADAHITLVGYDWSLWRLPETIQLVSGNNQTGNPNQQLPTPLVVKVLSSSGSAFANIPVHFSITQGGGTLNAYEVMTDANGLASCYWTLGPGNGINTVTAKVQKADGTNITGSPLVFAATAAGSSVIPTLTTSSVTNITQNAATSGGNVTSDGGATVTARGVCWSTSSNPTISGAHTSNGSGIGIFTSNLAGLSPNTLYYVRAYATNTVGTAYGNQLTFTTLANPVLPTVTTSAVTNITQNSASSGGNVTSDGGATVTVRGVCWSTSSNPTTSGAHTSNGSGTGIFASNLTGLSPNTLYYVRAYATNSVGTSYGNQLSFTTLSSASVPTVTTDPATAITQTTATSGGIVTSDGGATVTVRGVCWSTSSNPTTANSHTTDGSGTGTFTSYLTGLTPNTLYYVRAYATNSVGTAYGNEQSFTTLNSATIPTVTTDPATAITETTATSGGNVTGDGGATVTVRGVCWSTTSNPTTANSYTTDGSGTGAFTSYLTGLVQNTLYYVRSYATNSIGTAYGNEITFTTSSSGPQPCPGVPTVTYEGITYNTVQIGTQCWFRENLNVGNMIPVTQDQANNGIKEKYCYNNLESNCNVYGGLYQWNEMMQYVTIQGAQGLCPSGWHLPSDAEWCTLTNYIDPTVGCTSTGLSGTDAGDKMKSTSGWNSGGNGNNSSGFTALPGGYRYYTGTLYGLGGFAGFWSSTWSTSANSWDRYVNYDGGGVYRYSEKMTSGYSVRCVEN